MKTLVLLATLFGIAGVAPALACPRDVPAKVAFPAKSHVVAISAQAPAGDTISGLNGV
jgi:hypothetical protein